MSRSYLFHFWIFSRIHPLPLYSYFWCSLAGLLTASLSSPKLSHFLLQEWFSQIPLSLSQLPSPMHQGRASRVQISSRALPDLPRQRQTITVTLELHLLSPFLLFSTSRTLPTPPVLTSSWSNFPRPENILPPPTEFSYSFKIQCHFWTTNIFS